MTQTPMRRSRRGSTSGRSSSARSSTARSGSTARPGATARTSSATRTAQLRVASTAEIPTAGTATAAERAFERRRRRAARMTGDRLDHSGRSIRGSLSKVPFIALIILVLAVGAVGVLVLNTRTSETGVEIDRSANLADEYQLEIETLQREVAALDATPNLAARAKALGMVPAEESAIVDCTRTPCVVIKASDSASPGGNG